MMTLMIFSSLAMHVNTVDIDPQNGLGSGSCIAMVTTQPRQDMNISFLFVTRVITIH